MTIKEVLHQSLLRIFREEIDERFFLFVKGERDDNLLIGSGVPFGAENIHVKGRLDTLERFSKINPVSIKGMSIVSEYVIYWIRIVDENCFEILSGSNLMGRSTLELLKIKRSGVDNWIVESGLPCEVIPQQTVFKGDNEMAKGVFGILADYGNPYKRDQESMFFWKPSIDFVIDVEKAVLYVEGHAWFCFENF